jgi:hypothetical protein
LEACLRKMHKIARDGNLARGKEKNLGEEEEDLKGIRM